MSNIYLKVDFEFEAQYKGHWCKMNTTLHERNFGVDDINYWVDEITKILKEHDAMVTFTMDSIEWDYGKEISLGRIIAGYEAGKGRLVQWENGNTNVTENVTINKRTVRSFFNIITRRVLERREAV